MATELSELSRTLVRSRIPNYTLLSPEEQRIQAILTIKDDFYIYCEMNLMIKNKRGQMVQFQPNWAQRQLIDQVLDDLAHNRSVRYIILKARQMGLSTAIEALCFWWTTTHPNINSVIIAHKKKASKNLYKMFRRYYDNAHPYFHPTTKYNTKDDLTFDVEDKIKDEYRARNEKPPGLQSEIQTLVAAEGEGRSDTILFFHGSEVAFWDAGADVLSSALQAIPDGSNTFAFLESTANGIGGYFYDEWQIAKQGKGGFKPIFFAWHEHPEYMIDEEIDVLDDEELELIDIFKEKGYAEEDWNRKLAWRRRKMKQFHSDPKKFYQEYPKDDNEAFLASGRPVFDTKSLMVMEKEADKYGEPLFGEILLSGRNRGKASYELTLYEKKGGFDPTPLKVWESVDVGEKYVVAVDTAEGIEVSSDKAEGDYSVIDVMRVRDLKTVARWRGHIDPDQLGNLVFDVGTYYNYALVGVEVNNHGLVVVQRLRDLFYRNLYMRQTAEENQFQERTTHMGWLTTRKTKPLIISELVKAIRERDIIDLDKVFIRECMTYVRDDQGRTNAQEGMHDDTVMAKAIGLHLADYVSYAVENAKDGIQKPISRKLNNATSTNSALESIATTGYASRTGRKVRKNSHRSTIEARRAKRDSRKNRS